MIDGSPDAWRPLPPLRKTATERTTMIAVMMAMTVVTTAMAMIIITMAMVMTVMTMTMVMTMMVI